MLFRKMPKTGDLLSSLGFGCMRLPMKGRAIDEPRAIAQIRMAIDRGVNYVDTAWPYHAGQSEVVLGKALRDGYRDKVRLATKLPTWMIKTRADMDRYLAAQFEKLGTDHIDYYLVHSLTGPAWEGIKSLGVREFLDAAKQDGRIGNAGFSYHGLPEDFKKVVDAYPWVFCQIMYNYLDQNFQAGTAGLEYAASRGLGVVVMEPLRGGTLARPTPPAAISEIWNESPVRRTPAEWGLRFVWNRPEVVVVLSGMNDEAQIEENLSTARSATPNSLSADELALIDRAARKYKELMKIGCTACSYCMPCPQGVMIPNCFDEYNKMHMFGPVEEARFVYAFRMSGIIANAQPGYASQCIGCGDCLPKCPQQITIPQTLAQVAAEMEGPDLEDRVARARAIFVNEA
ncbi:aldo/keto reductase [bacterium]|nr:aldo/keto reductase [bacterium]